MFLAGCHGRLSAMRSVLIQNKAETGQSPFTVSRHRAVPGDETESLRDCVKIETAGAFKPCVPTPERGNEGNTEQQTQNRISRGIRNSGTLV